MPLTMMYFSKQFSAQTLKQKYENDQPKMMEKAEFVKPSSFCRLSTQVKAAVQISDLLQLPCWESVKDFNFDNVSASQSEFSNSQLKFIDIYVQQLQSFHMTKARKTPSSILNPLYQNQWSLKAQPQSTVSPCKSPPSFKFTTTFQARWKRLFRSFEKLTVKSLRQVLKGLSVRVSRGNLVSMLVLIQFQMAFIISVGMLPVPCQLRHSGLNCSTSIKMMKKLSFTLILFQILQIDLSKTSNIYSISLSINQNECSIRFLASLTPSPLLHSIFLPSVFENQHFSYSIYEFKMRYFFFQACRKS